MEYQKYAHLTVVSRAPNRGKKVYFNCVCDCGREKCVQAGHLRNGSITNCGCITRAKIHNHAKRGEISSTFISWMAMKARCLNPKHRAYKNYGGRGITISPEFLGPYGFVNFLAHMGERPEGRSLDRIDVNGNYEPGNCRWATSKEQAQNKRNSRRVISALIAA